MIPALMPNYARADLAFERGEGAWLWTVDGRRFLDFGSGIATASLGHGHPHLMKAIAEQAAKVMHTSNLYRIPQAERLAQRLVDATFADSVFFCNSGAEANECAIKVARRWAGRGRYVVVSTENSFHGRTLAALAATGQAAKHTGFEPMPAGFPAVPFDDLEAMAKALEGADVAAVLVEAIQGEGGVVVPSSDYLRGLRDLCTEHGALLMVDEVQTGFGRTGEWFAFQHEHLEPDVVTMAKALGNGMPVGACWARAEVAAAMVPGDHGSTFGGQPLAMAAVRATLGVMEAEDVCGRATAAGSRLRDGLGSLDAIGGVRGRGLLLAAQLTGGGAAAASAACLEAGLLVNAVRPDALRFSPSLLVGNEQIDAALAIVAAALEGLQRAGAQ